MKNKWIYILLVGIFSVSCHKDVEINQIRLTECSSIPEAVASGCCFSYDDKVYIFGGRTNNGVRTSQLWKYTPATDEWTSLGDAPIKARVSCSACVVGERVYIGLGYNGPIHNDVSYLRDFWAYDPSTNEWTRLADFPANTTVKNCLFASDGAIYAVYGFFRKFTQNVYRYDIEQDKWEQVDVQTSNHVPRAMDIVGATCQERYFLGTGFNHTSLRFWAEWDPNMQQYIPRQKILGAGRNAAACCATDKYVYLIGGRYFGDTLTTGFFYKSVQRYSPSNDEWEYVGSLPYEAENMVAISVDGKIFMGLGETSDGKIQSNWYKFEE